MKEITQVFVCVAAAAITLWCIRCAQFMNDIERGGYIDVRTTPWDQEFRK